MSVMLRFWVLIHRKEDNGIKTETEEKKEYPPPLDESEQQLNTDNDKTKQ